MKGIDEMTWSAGCSVVTPSASRVVTLTARPSTWWILTTGELMTTSVPASSTSSRQRSHIIPGPYFGYSNVSMRLVTCLLLSPRPPAMRARIGSHTAVHSVMPLIRCAPQSAEICEGGRAHSFVL